MTQKVGAPIRVLITFTANGKSRTGWYTNTDNPAFAFIEYDGTGQAVLVSTRDIDQRMTVEAIA